MAAQIGSLFAHLPGGEKRRILAHSGLERVLCVSF